MSSISPIRILLVEDDMDVANLMIDLLTSEGFEVIGERTAETALSALKEGGFAAVLTNYRLPLESGAWLLDQASRQGLLERTRAIVLTAEAVPVGVEAYPVLHKPVDLDFLLSELARVKRNPSEAPPPPMEVVPPALELALYVTLSSKHSLRARRNLDLILDRFDRSRIRLNVLEMGNPGDPAWTAVCDEDRIVVTPTLVKRHPAPKMWILGDLSKHEVVESMIETALEAQ